MGLKDREIPIKSTLGISRIIALDKNYFVIRWMNQKGRTVNIITVPELSQKKLKNYKSMGTAGGMNVYHCIFLATKYAKNFCNRVAGYVINPKDLKKNPRFSYQVTFYEKK
ncbi:MAG: hypothetical protein AAB885_02780 [Patescibacteria group bacterium]